MNKYETWQALFKETDTFEIELNVHGGWDMPICLQCAIAALETIGTCNHIEYIRNEYGPRIIRTYYNIGFTSFDGGDLRYNIGRQAECGCEASDEQT